MWMICFFVLLALTLLSIVYWGYRELLKRAQIRFYAWNNVLGQQNLLLEQTGTFLENEGKSFPKTRLNKVILSIRNLLDASEDDIKTIGNYQSIFIEAVIELLNSVSDSISDEKQDWWLQTQDTLISQINDLVLAQSHFNQTVIDYNQWRELFFVYWIANKLGYKDEIKLPISDNILNNIA